MKISIRSARMADVDDITRLTVQLGYDVERATAVPRLSRALSSADQQFLVAELDGRVVGWVHVAIWEFLETERFGLIAGLVVDKSRRKQGIGRLLMDHAEEWSAKQGLSGPATCRLTPNIIHVRRKRGSTRYAPPGPH